jgi:hypothetical protein
VCAVVVLTCAHSFAAEGDDQGVEVFQTTTPGGIIDIGKSQIPFTIETTIVASTAAGAQEAADVIERLTAGDTHPDQRIGQVVVGEAGSESLGENEVAKRLAQRNPRFWAAQFVKLLKTEIKPPQDLPKRARDFVRSYLQSERGVRHVSTVVRILTVTGAMTASIVHSGNPTTPDQLEALLYQGICVGLSVAVPVSGVSNFWKNTYLRLLSSSTLAEKLGFPKGSSKFQAMNALQFAGIFLAGEFAVAIMVQSSRHYVELDHGALLSFDVPGLFRLVAKAIIGQGFFERSLGVWQKEKLKRAEDQYGKSSPEYQEVYRSADRRTALGVLVGSGLAMWSSALELGQRALYIDYGPIQLGPSDIPNLGILLPTAIALTSMSKLPAFIAKTKVVLTRVMGEKLARTLGVRPPTQEAVTRLACNEIYEPGPKPPTD